MKGLLRGTVSRTLVASGVTWLGRRLRRHDGAMILYGHRVAHDDEGYLQGLQPEQLREQLSYLTRHYEVISLETLVSCVEAKRPAPPKSIVLTFDDGFRDNVEVALPILNAFSVTATIFVVTRCLTTGELPWSQRLGYVFQHTLETTLSHPIHAPDAIRMHTPAERRSTYSAVKARLASLSRSERDDHIASLAHLLGVEPPDDRMMTWGHARELMDTGHGIGAHTYSHALLARVGMAEARSEMMRSRDDLSEFLGVTRPSFCFPAGSVSQPLLDVARELGFRSAFLPNRTLRLNHAEHANPFSLVRTGLPNASAAQLEAELDGPYHLARRLLGRYR